MKFKSNIKKIFASLCSSVFLFSLVNVNAMESSLTATSEEEYHAVKAYTSCCHRCMNEYLRGEKISFEDVDYITALNSDLSIYIRKNRIKEGKEYPKLLYRGIDEKGLNAILEPFEIDINNIVLLKDRSFIHEAFMSTSSIPIVAIEFCRDEGAVLEIEIRDIKKVKVADVRKISSMENEEEFLFDKGHTLTIREVSRENGILIFKCDVVYKNQKM